MFLGLGSPAPVVVVGALGAAIYGLSAFRAKRLRNDIHDDLAGLESRLEKKIKNKQDLFLGSLILTLERQAPGNERHPLAKKAEIAASVKRADSEGY